MADLTLIKPLCKEISKTERLSAILEKSLDGYTYDTIARADEFHDLENKRILFAVSLGESGVNLEFYEILKKIRLDKTCFEGSIAGIIIDGNSELYTKSVARELAFTANLSGCTFPGKALVEGTKSLDNYNIVARNLEMENLQAYMHSGRLLVKNIINYEHAKRIKPKLLVLHAGNYHRSNTISLWELVKKYLGECDITTVSLRNGSVEDCIGCPYKTCKHYGEQGNCFYGGVIVEKVYPAIQECDALVMLCPNYNDAVGANLSAFINRLTALLTKTKFYDKYLFSIIVSGYSGSDILAQQLISALNMNKTFALPGRFAMMETANNPMTVLKLEGLEERAEAFAKNIMSYTSVKEC